MPDHAPVHVWDCQPPIAGVPHKYFTIYTLEASPNYTVDIPRLLDLYIARPLLQSR